MMETIVISMTDAQSIKLKWAAKASGMALDKFIIVAALSAANRIIADMARDSVLTGQAQK